MPEDLQRLNILDAAHHPDWYFEGGFLVYTAGYHLKRGYWHVPDGSRGFGRAAG